MNLIEIIKKLFAIFAGSKESAPQETVVVSNSSTQKVYMISMEELLNKKYELADQTQDIQDNLNILLERVNKIRTLWGKPMTVTSGLRTMEDHLRIYREKAEKAGVPFDETKVPKKSKHLYGQAVDISDPNKELQEWCKNNESVLKSIGLWMESFSATPNWCHFQIVQYGSYVEGKSIWFNP